MSETDSARIPPHDLDAEAAVLSACLLSPDVLADVRWVLSAGAGAFYADANRRIYEAVIALDDAGDPIDATTVSAWLRQRGWWEMVGAAYLAQIIDATPAVSHAEHHAKILSQLHRRRAVILECQKIMAEAYTDVGEDVDAWAADVSGRVADVAGAGKAKETLFVLGDVVDEIWDELQGKSDETGPIGKPVSTGLRKLDERLGGGLSRGVQQVIAARPGHGKTALALNLAVHVAADDVDGECPQGQGVIFISAEMPRRDLTKRAMAQQASVGTDRLVGGKTLAREEWAALQAASSFLKKIPLAIEDAPAQTIAGIRLAARRAAAKLRRRFGPNLPIALVVVDYLQILKAERNRGDTREQAVAEMSRQLMWMAREMGCAVLTLSQLNRDKDRKHWTDYKLDDLRESGAIEQDAYSITFIHRDDANNNDEETHNGLADLIVAKLRQGGAKGRVRTYFDAPATRFFGDASSEPEGPGERRQAPGRYEDDSDRRHP